jgi:hypothetical protein
MPLVGREDAGVVREEGLQMAERLEQGIGSARGWWWPLAAEPASRSIQSASHPPDNTVSRLQGKRQAQRFGGGSDRLAGKQGAQQRPEQRSREGVARQNLREEQREGFSTAAPLPAIRAKHPLASGERTVHHRRIVPAQHAVAVERATASAMRTAVPLERKSTALNSSLSSTKRIKVETIETVLLAGKPTAQARLFKTARRSNPRGSFPKKEAINRGARHRRHGSIRQHLHHALIVNPLSLTTTLRLKHGTLYDQSSAHNTLS